MQVEIAPKPFAMLCYLAKHRDRVVPKTELLERVWPDVVVSDAALSSALKDLRRALGDDGSRASIIQTLRRRGIRLVARVVTDASAGEASGAPLARSPLSGRGVPFVGRARELRDLIRCAEAAARGSPRVAIVIGEPGAGKSRLVEELIRHASCAEFKVTIGFCDDAATPYLPFVQALRALILQGGVGSAWGRDVGDATLQALLRPELPADRRLASSHRVEGARERADLFSSIWRTIADVARRERTLLVIEDLHRADAASLDLFASLAADVSDAQAAGGAPVLLIATTQPPRSGSRLAAVLGRIAGQSGCSSVSLAGFSIRATGELLAALGAARSPLSVPRALRELSGGNPLFIRELAREGGSLEQVASSKPDDLRAAINYRIARLDDGARDALRVAAFIGDRFGLSALSAAVGERMDDLGPRLRAAIRLGVLVGDERSFRFDHALVREVLQDATPPARRREIHRDLAAVLEDLYAGDQGEHAVEIARHLLAAGDLVDPDRLILCATRAGNQAFGVCAWHDAVTFYDAALSAPSRFSHAERAELHLRAGLSASHDGEATRALGHYDRAVRDYREAKDDVGAAWAAMYSARTYLAISPSGFPRGHDLESLEELVRKLGESEPALRALLLGTIAEGTWGDGEPGRAEHLALQALALGQGIDDDVVCHHASMVLGRSRFSRLQLREALGSWLDADEYARRSRDPWFQTTPGPAIALALGCLGRFAQGLERASTAQSLARRANNLGEYSLALAHAAAIDLAAGRLAAADQGAHAALAHPESAAFPWAGAVALIVRASVAAHRGAWKQAESRIDLLSEPGQAFGEENPTTKFIVGAYRALIRSRQSPESVTRGSLVELVGLAPSLEMSGFLLSSVGALVEAALEVGAHDERRPLQGTLEIAAENGYLLTGAWPFLLPRLLARCAAADGRVDAARVAFDQAIQAADACGALGELARARLDRARFRAQIANGRGRNGEVLADASAAAQLADSIGLRPLARQALLFARRARDP